MCLGSAPDREQIYSFFEHIKTLRCHHIRGEGTPHSGNIREEAMPIGHSPCTRNLVALPWNYRSADDQQQGRLLDCGRFDIASPDGTWLFVPAGSPNRSAGA